MATSMHTLALSAIEAIEKATTPSEVHEAVQATIEQIGYANCVMVKMPERGESTQDNLIMNTRPAAFADILGSSLIKLIFCFFTCAAHELPSLGNPYTKIARRLSTSALKILLKPME